MPAWWPRSQTSCRRSISVAWNVATGNDRRRALIEHSLTRRDAAARLGVSAQAVSDMLERGDLDIVIISTPWEWHVKMCVDTMRRNKHAFVEVPAAITVEGCWELVETAEKTQRYCMMM